MYWCHELRDKYQRTLIHQDVSRYTKATELLCSVQIH